MAWSSGSVTAPPPAAAMVKTNFEAFRTLIESRRPTRICAGATAVSVPGAPLQAQ